MSTTTSFQDFNHFKALAADYPIRLIPFSKFVDFGTFPRYPDNQDLSISLIQFTEEVYNRSLIVFVSHCWLRGWEGAEGWDGRAHPDDAAGNKYALCVKGIEEMMEYLCPGMEECYLWIDYSCIDQDTVPEGELRLLDKIVQVSDCIFTPIFDQHAQSWEIQKIFNNLFEAYKSEAWNGPSHSYVNRGWCRVEMFYAANLPLLTESEERKDKFAAGFAFHSRAGRRPHILYGSKEKEGRQPPRILPPLQNIYYERYHPARGEFTKEGDKQIIESLVLKLSHLIEDIKVGYDGDTNAAGIPHGKGIYKYKDCAVYEGDWKDGVMCGRGVYKYSDGDVYEGDWKDGVKCGNGIVKFANGQVYEGDWKDGVKCGKGIVKCANGNVQEGDWKDDVMCGRGVVTYANGNVYEGDIKDDTICGKGIYKYVNGDIYEGDFISGVMCGKGIVKLFTNGEVYDGDFKDGVICGKGIYKDGNGDIYEGDFKDGVKCGKGIVKYADGDIYEGDFISGVMCGKGIFKFANGNVYEGDIKDDTMCGEGIFKDTYGNLYVGDWKDGLQCGKGIYKSVSGDVYGGLWQDGKFVTVLFTM